MKTFETSTKNNSVQTIHLPQDVRTLAEKIEELPETYREMLRPYVENMLRGTQRRHEIFTEFQESVAQLRLDMKYLIFDLEATRRERDSNTPS